MVNNRKYIALATAVFALILSSCIFETNEPANPLDPHLTGVNVSKIRVASFNIWKFDEDKATNTAVMDVLAQVVVDNGFDILAVQEIGYISSAEYATAANTLKTAINEKSSTTYDYVLSDRSGTGVLSLNECYAYFYNTAKVSVFDDDFISTNTNFVRPPYIAKFKAGYFDFIMVTFHAKASSPQAGEEMKQLLAVVDEAKLTFTGEDDVIVLGDFNADGAYFDADSTNNAFFSSSDYYKIITNGVDTTVAASTNTYDRIFCSLDAQGNFNGESGVFVFDTIAGSVTPSDVSDHYPIWAEFNALIP